MGALPQRPFPDPASVEAAEALLAELTDATMLIQSQLANQNRTTEDGVRLSDRDYHQWRHSAIFALEKKRAEMRHLKGWLAVRRVEAHRIEAGVRNPNNAVELFGCLLRIVTSSIHWADLTPEEVAVVRLSERWIRMQGAPAVVAARARTGVAS